MNTPREMLCIVCPVGCTLKVTKSGDSLHVEGNACPRGARYATQECIAPERNIASTIRVRHGIRPVVSVKTDAAIPKDKIFEAMACINHTVVDAPVAAGQVLIPNLFCSDVNIVATHDLERKEIACKKE